MKKHSFYFPLLVAMVCLAVVACKKKAVRQVTIDPIDAVMGAYTGQLLIHTDWEPVYGYTGNSGSSDSTSIITVDATKSANDTFSISGINFSYLGSSFGYNSSNTFGTRIDSVCFNPSADSIYISVMTGETRGIYQYVTYQTFRGKK